MLEIIVVGDRDQSVEILTGKLVLEADIGVAEDAELGDEGGELDGAINREDLGLAADVGELVIVGTRVDLAAIAAHELDLRRLVERLVLPRSSATVFKFQLPGSGRRLAGFRIGVVTIVLH